MDVLEELHKDDPEQFLDISQLCKVSVSQFYGIEIEQFPAEIAKVALWLMDHLCNMEVADRFGQYFARIPIKDSPHIVCANALTMDWPRSSYIFGNPPFLGASSDGMDAAKKADMLTLFPKNKNLDFVCGWYKKANDLIQGTATRCAFVSTNSITQGEQVAALWKNLNAEIDFAYRTFKWHNEAKGNAAVHCVIIGFHAKEARAEAQRHEELLSLRGDSEFRRSGEDSKKLPTSKPPKLPVAKANMRSHKEVIGKGRRSIAVRRQGDQVSCLMSPPSIPSEISARFALHYSPDLRHGSK